jgi:Arc/MetJ-type ribon-helix-helix transcriptional regulator
MGHPRRAVTLALRPELAGSLDSCVQSGRFPSAGEAVEAALLLLQNRDRESQDRLDALHATVERILLDARIGDLLDGPCRVRGSGRSR